MVPGVTEGGYTNPGRVVMMTEPVTLDSVVAVRTELVTLDMVAAERPELVTPSTAVDEGTTAHLRGHCRRRRWMGRWRGRCRSRR